MTSENKDIENVAIIGLGYVGLPTSIAFHDSGFRVTGLDVDVNVIEKLSRGISHLSDSTIGWDIPYQSSRWKITSDYEEAVKSSDMVVITVPTPTHEDKTPDLSFVEMAMDSTIKNVKSRSGTIVVLESTVFPGVTRMLAERSAKKYDLVMGEDFQLAYSPERVSPGDIGKSASQVARIVGSIDEKVGMMLAEVYGKITSGGCTYVGEIEVAEAAKMVENTQRDIDIAFVNELSKTLPSIGLDVMDVLKAARTKWNFHYHEPGIGVGGHCIPVDPYYYIELCRKSGTKSEISPVSRMINESMPIFAVEKIKHLLNGAKGKEVLVLGYSYKPGLGDSRETPVKIMIEELEKNGTRVMIWDPFVEDADFPEWCENIDNPIGTECDMVVLATAHDDCLSLDWVRILKNCRSGVVFDGRRALDRSEMERIGWKYHGIGV
tara:strand:- start:731 stop:2035 length:1305 start_codon:yes stop_codon:yes gene_type:complete